MTFSKKEVDLSNIIELWYSVEKQAVLAQYQGVTLVFKDAEDTGERFKFLTELNRTGHFSQKTCHQEVSYSEQVWNDLLRFFNKKGASNGDSQEVREE